ncbi:hypothetical protein KCTC52924_00695 [Arenibacter antarcticus]|nr:hypothetical protein [Arenibacter sp. H213]
MLVERGFFVVDSNVINLIYLMKETVFIQEFTPLVIDSVILSILGYNTRQIKLVFSRVSGGLKK